MKKTFAIITSLGICALCIAVFIIMFLRFETDATLMRNTSEATISIQNGKPLPHYDLKGQGVTIGVVEVRAAMGNGFNIVHPALRHILLENTRNYHQYEQNTSSLKRCFSDQIYGGLGHGTGILSIMASRSKKYPGLAPEATYFCTVAETDKEAMQAIVDSVDKRAVDLVNLSFSCIGKPDALNAISVLADYLSKQKSILFITSGGGRKGCTPLPPGDAYNVLTVKCADKLLEKCGVDETCVRVASGRSVVDVLALGDSVPIATGCSSNPEKAWTVASGSSYATAYVTGKLTLLWEYVDKKSLSPLLHKPLVQRAIVINSVSKKIMDSSNHLWRETEAAKNSQYPLDDELGAGLFNFEETLHSFQTSRGKSSKVIEKRGWDFNEVQAGQNIRYKMRPIIQSGKNFRVTLTFERHITVQRNISSNDMSFHVFGEDIHGVDLDEDGIVDGPDMFTEQKIPNLDLCVYFQDDTYPLAVSDSAVDTVEHLYFKTQNEGYYSLEIRCISDENLNAVPYALAWWVD